MFKYLLLIVIMFVGSLNANSKDLECICLSVDKEFAKELKVLIKKYKPSIKITSLDKKNIDISDKVIAKIELKQKIQEKKNQQKELDTLVESGKKLFISRCVSCHGKKANEEAYGKARALNSLTLEDMQTSIKGYQDGNYDNGFAMIMSPIASGLLEEDVKALYKYIQSLK